MAKLTPAQNIQLRAFELDLYGYDNAEIAQTLNKEQNLRTMKLTAEHVETLIKAETIAYAIASELGYTKDK